MLAEARWRLYWMRLSLQLALVDCSVHGLHLRSLSSHPRSWYILLSKSSRSHMGLPDCCASDFTEPRLLTKEMSLAAPRLAPFYCVARRELLNILMEHRAGLLDVTAFPLPNEDLLICLLLISAVSSQSGRHLDVAFKQLFLNIRGENPRK